MLRAERFLANRQRPQQERFRYGVATHRSVKFPQLVEAG